MEGNLGLLGIVLTWSWRPTYRRLKNGVISVKWQDCNFFITWSCSRPIGGRRTVLGKIMKTKFKRQFFLVTFVVIISTVFALILGEIMLRLIGFEFEFYPTKVQFGWPDPVILQNAYRVDKELLWVPKDYYSKLATWKGKRPTAVFMGDSCTQFGRYDKFLKSIIYEQNPNSTFTLVNVGVGGWSSFQGLQQLKRDVLPIMPRFVTIYYGWNDHWTSFGIEDKNIGKFNLEHPILLLKLSSKSRVVQLINRAIFTLKQSSPVQNKRRQERVSLVDFASNLHRMVQIAQENGITPILLTAPSSHKKGKEPAYLTRRWLNDLHELVPLHQKYVQAVRDIASEEHVPLIDLYAEFDLLPQKDLKELFRKDGIHLTEEGNRKIAEFIYKYLVGKNLYNRLVGKE